MPWDKDIVTLAVTSETTFYSFESISIIDAGATDGFQVLGTDAGGKASAWITVPTGIPYNAGQSGNRIIRQLSLKATAGKSLNAIVSIIY